MLLMPPTFQFNVETEKQFTNDLLFALDFISLSALNLKYLYFLKKKKTTFFSLATKCERKVKVLVTQLCSNLCDPIDCSLPVSSVHGIFPGKNIGVEIAISFSRGSF